MGSSRRDTLQSLMLVSLALPIVQVAFSQNAEQSTPQDHNSPFPKTPADEPRMPNGKSQRNEMARQQHADALKDVDTLVAAAEELRDELKRAGDYTVPVSSLRKTEEIEKLAKRIRGRLKN